MIPQGSSLKNNPTAGVAQQTSRTYRIDIESGRIIGMIDGLDAVKQAVFHILQTERFEYLIYSANHGTELSELPGKGHSYIQAEIGRRIRAALLQDDRIMDVIDMQVTVSGDEALAEFTVVSEYGRFEASKEVK